LYVKGLASYADAVRASGPEIAQLAAAIQSAASPEAAAQVVTQLAAWQRAAVPALAIGNTAELQTAAAALAEQGRQLQADAERYLGGAAAATVAEAIDRGMDALTAPLRETR
jgi:hypothetical protein